MPQITPIAANSSHPRLLNPHSSTSLWIQRIGVLRCLPAATGAAVYRLRQTPSGPTCRQVPPPPAGGLGDGLGAGFAVPACAGEAAPVPAPGVRAGFALPASVGPLPPAVPWLPEPWLPEPWPPEPWPPETRLPRPGWELPDPGRVLPADPPCGPEPARTRFTGLKAGRRSWIPPVPPAPPAVAPGPGPRTGDGPGTACSGSTRIDTADSARKTITPEDSSSTGSALPAGCKRKMAPARQAAVLIRSASSASASCAAGSSGPAPTREAIRSLRSAEWRSSRVSPGTR